MPKGRPVPWEKKHKKKRMDALLRATHEDGRPGWDPDLQCKVRKIVSFLWAFTYMKCTFTYMNFVGFLWEFHV